MLLPTNGTLTRKAAPSTGRALDLGGKQLLREVQGFAHLCQKARAF